MGNAEYAAGVRPERTYDKGERRFKHVGNVAEAVIKFDDRNPRHWWGECPNNLRAADHTSLLNEAIAAPNGDREIDFPKRVFTVHEGAIYRAETTDWGRSYHGYPFRGKLGKAILAELGAIADKKGCRAKFDDWMKMHIEVHGR